LAGIMCDRVFGPKGELVWDKENFGVTV